MIWKNIPLPDLSAGLVASPAADRCASPVTIRRSGRGWVAQGQWEQGRNVTFSHISDPAFVFEICGT
jgi:hypothetical protein